MRRISFGISSLVLITVLSLATGFQVAQATVVPGWPAGAPNTCRNSDDFFLNFESGIDEIEIESTIPSMQFTNTGGLNWQYGDIRTGKYNVYPYQDGQYETNGNFFAWLGPSGDQGRIDFLGGGASYCSVLVSTSSGVTLDAYDSDDSLIATSGWAANNLETGTLTQLTVEAPTGQTIAYVIVHDTGNYWLMDDLCTDANKAVIPVPTRDIGSHSDRIDVIFVPEEDYGAPADIDTWLPNFIQDVQDQIDQRLNAAAPVTGNLDSFNFYYTRTQGEITTVHNLPADITRVAPWADAYAILHIATFGDWTQWGPPTTLSAEGAVGRSFIHEAGHGLFGLADEYDDAPGCRTARFEPNPNPNVWDAEADCRADVTSEGWGDPDDCWLFSTCTSGWWKFTTTRFIMDDGTQFANGWGQPATRRIQWIIDNNPGTAPAEAGSSGETDKSIWMNIRVSGGVFTLEEESYVVAGPPSNRSNGGAFRVKVFSNGNAQLEEFGIHDPRILQAEEGYAGPTWRDEANFQLVVPYFPYCGRVDLIEPATGNVLLSVGISQYATVTPPVAICQDIVVKLDENGEATITAGDVDNGSYDPEGRGFELSIDKTYFTCDDLGANSVTLTVTNEDGAPAACTATVTVVDDIPPEVSLSVSPDTLWPPNHKMVPVTVTAETLDNCDPNPACQIVQVQSNEPIDGLGDGDTSPDWQITGDLSVDLRAERSGTGTGRIYTVTVECADNSGNTTEADASVTVPHEK
ncbi:hypothetical protein [Desulfosarcina ovata]|uniref:HYR domain-containing protein n=1 Tax=Desulfosarcina ovata subsp. ovata TaxID=2752305 RepID=A0A5K8A5L4_9BACT|nr:hypothetical protein [Desulfosarcina ovata]BBO87759.1 hypothetical protein DSCOOX_09390 [Desulfosarcina ovata subsp. ovata]